MGPLVVMLVFLTCIWTLDPSLKAQALTPCYCPGQTLALASAAPCILPRSSRFPNCVDSYRQQMAPLVVAWVIAAPNFPQDMPAGCMSYPWPALLPLWCPHSLYCSLPGKWNPHGTLERPILYHECSCWVWDPSKQVVAWQEEPCLLMGDQKSPKMNGFGWGECMGRKYKRKGTVIAKIWRLKNISGKLPWPGRR